jgi:hypothetical protein
MKKAKRQPKPKHDYAAICKNICVELMMLEYQIRQMGKQAELDAARLLSLAASIGRMRDITLKLNNQ